ncbi:uncharacterized protein TNCV_3040181 [Trichonephila clavipes]|nr:uncharacterized protein TNCV_3040181 [Trichonephila clavipes]
MTGLLVAQKIGGRKKSKKLKLQRTYHCLTNPERSISALKRVKSEMRSAVGKERLNSLMLLCTQNDITMDIDCNDVVNDFARIKTRRKSLLYQYNDNDSTKNKDVENCQVIYSQFDLAIHQNDHQVRRRFVEWAQNEIAVVPDFHKRILFSDEAHFWLNGYVKKQNYRIWSEANPQVYVETPLHPEELTVWCALWAGGIIGPYFFKNDEGHNVTVNGDRYRAMVTNFFIPDLNNHDVQELWFQQDGATCHTACATIDLLKDTFGDRLISRF